MAFVLLTLLLIIVESADAAALLLRDGARAILLLAAACGWGLWPMTVLGPPDADRPWLALGAVALGLGVLATLALVLGCVGLLDGPLWWAALALGWLLGAIYVALRRSLFAGASWPTAAAPWLWLLLALAPFLALGALSAATPPGVLWAEEGHGYDVLEYHLALPKEYLRHGRIAYLPHNVYANFPANVEMLYLWTFVLRGEPWSAVFSAKMLNLMLGLLAVCACWLAGREFSKRAGLLAALLAGGSGWLVYLSGVAYVENGLLLFAVLSLAATLRALGAEPPAAKRWAGFAGLLAGLACGCKYSAIGLVAVPLLIAHLVGALRRRGASLAAAPAFVLACLAAFSPWLIKNAATTGDPLFPLGWQIFADYPPGWDAHRDAHFRICHLPQPDEARLAGRLARLGQRVLAGPDQRVGTWLWVLAPVALLACRRDRQVRALGLVLLIQLLVWLFASHLYARFAVPMLLPLVLLAARLEAACRSRRLARAYTVLVLAGLAVNLCFAVRLYAAHLYPGGQHIPAHGLVRLFTEGDWPMQQHLGALNALPADAKVLMVGDARTFYVRPDHDYCVTFNRNELAKQVRDAAVRNPDDFSAAVLAWLRDRGYTHVFVNFSEIARLRNSQYGFPPALTPRLFDRLQSAGLELIDLFHPPRGSTPYAALYFVPAQ